MWLCFALYTVLCTCTLRIDGCLSVCVECLPHTAMYRVSGRLVVVCKVFADQIVDIMMLDSSLCSSVCIQRRHGSIESQCTV
jgi:hypothetical protein